MSSKPEYPAENRPGRSKLGRGLKVVAIGGGHGLPIVIKSALSYAEDIVAVATVADDGGSSGRLREELGILPPGDSRNCLVAMAGGDIMSRLFQYRFTRGEGIAGHTLGNLLIAALTDITGDFGKALDYAGRLVRARGRVLPPTKEHVTLCAQVESSGTVCGQVNVANRLLPLKSIWLEPENPPANAEAVAAIAAADQIIIGPGSLFTSVLPNLLVPGIRDGIADSRAQRVFICNSMVQPGETDGFSAGDHAEAILRYTGKRLMDIVVTNRSDFSAKVLEELAENRVYPVADDKERLAGLDFEQVTADLANSDSPARHDDGKLGRVLAGLAERLG